LPVSNFRPMTETERHDYVNAMAEMILTHPTVTARELARALGFSQERSVYYWLHKAGFAGLNEFRTAVLTGEYRIALRSGRGTMPFRARHVAELPLLAAERSPAGAPIDYVLTTRTVSPDAFAVTAESDDYRPLVERNDVLLVDPEEEPSDGDLVLVRCGAEPPRLCRIYVGPRRLYVHPVTGKPLPELLHGAVTVLGRIVALHRSF